MTNLSPTVTICDPTCTLQAQWCVRSLSLSGWQIQCTSGFYKHYEGHTGWPSRPDGGRASPSLLAQLGLQEDFVSVECSLHEAS